MPDVSTPQLPAPMKKHLLLILDGYGIAEDPSVSAIDHANKPFLDDLFARYPHGTLRTSGLDVGLPRGQMGNSEVGHMNLGAGRVVYQEITRIDKAIRDGEFFENEVLIEAMRAARDGDRRLHLMGLLSDGGVHSHQNHLHALLEFASRRGLSGDDVCVHAFMDGRDTDPHGGEKYLSGLEEAMERTGTGVVASVVGRYYAMDRDNRWERTEEAYRLLVDGEGERFDSAEEAVRDSYEHGVTDEFVRARAIGSPEAVRRTRIADGDSVVFFNFRADRARQITRALTEPGLKAFDRTPPAGLHFVTFTPYDEDFDFPVAFAKVNLTETIGEIIARAGLRQLRAAETEKYPHVTYFFSGGREDAFENEDRILVPSPKVATYDLQPEMSAPELARRVAAAVSENDYALVVLNFANPDMVGHTGDFDAAVKAVEAVDAGVREVVEAAVGHGYGVSIIADHGNADRMKNPDGTPHTAHTTVPVPHLVILDGYEGPVRDGRLADIAPTILAILGIEAPPVMTGDVLVDVSG